MNRYIDMTIEQFREIMPDLAAAFPVNLTVNTLPRWNTKDRDNILFLSSTNCPLAQQAGAVKGKPQV